MGDSSRIWPGDGLVGRDDGEGGVLGGEDAAVGGSVDGGDVDAVLLVGPRRAHGEAGDGAAGLLGFGDDALGDQPAVGGRGDAARR